MRLNRCVALIVVAAATSAGRSEARAESSLPVESVAISASPTLALRGSFGVSGAIGFAKRHAVRLNVARYEPFDFATLVPDSESTTTGQVRDLGIGYQFFPAGLWRGLSLEVGVLARTRDTREIDYDATSDVDSRTYAANALVGWSGTIRQRVLVAFAAGASFGRERGTEVTHGDSPRAMPVTTELDRGVVRPAGYFRVGLVFGKPR